MPRSTLFQKLSSSDRQRLMQRHLLRTVKFINVAHSNRPRRQRARAQHTVNRLLRLKARLLRESLEADRAEYLANF